MDPTIWPVSIGYWKTVQEVALYERLDYLYLWTRILEYNVAHSLASRPSFYLLSSRFFIPAFGCVRLRFLIRTSSCDEV
jgi:hypothetical protein